MQTFTRTFAAARLTATLAATLLVAAGTASAAHAQTTPDLTGTWELNTAKSDFGPMPAPSKVTMVVTQSATSIKLVQAIATPAGEQSNTQEFSLDGQAKTSNGVDGQPITSVGKIDSGMVVIDVKANRQGMDITQALRFSVAPDGRTLTLNQDVASSMGGARLKMVFDRK